MLALLSLGVLGFQLVILVSLIGAALLGRTWLKTAAFLWVAFTLFGSIFTMGLLMLQIVTIVVGYLLGSRVCKQQDRRLQAKSADSQ